MAFSMVKVGYITKGVFMKLILRACLLFAVFGIASAAATTLYVRAEPGLMGGAMCNVFDSTQGGFTSEILLPVGQAAPSGFSLVNTEPVSCYPTDYQVGAALPESEFIPGVLTHEFIPGVLGMKIATAKLMGSNAAGMQVHAYAGK